jgi:DNA-binding PadR family transcriptional regulator
MTEDMRGVLANVQQEMRRGAIILCVLSLLQTPRYGYALVERLQTSGMPVEPGTLYPLLRRLEKQGLLQSEWETAGPKPRKYYVMSEEGREAYRLLSRDWTEMQATINDMIQEGESHEP